MVRWWQVNQETPSGLRLNRAWHVRQFLFALIPPAVAFIILESLNRWDNVHKAQRVQNALVKKEAGDEAKRKISANVTEDKETIRQLQDRMVELERKIASITSNHSSSSSHVGPPKTIPPPICPESSSSKSVSGSAAAADMATAAAAAAARTLSPMAQRRLNKDRENHSEKV